VISEQLSVISDRSYAIKVTGTSSSPSEDQLRWYYGQNRHARHSSEVPVT